MEVSTLFSPIGRFIGRYHPTIFLAIVSLLLASAILLLYLTLQLSTTPDLTYTGTDTISRNFDTETVKKIQQLHESSEVATPLTFPAPRSSPFVE